VDGFVVAPRRDESGRLEYGNFKYGISKFFRVQAPDIPQSRQKNICRNLEANAAAGISGVPSAAAEATAFPRSASVDPIIHGRRVAIRR
jgi:hypothetical protein